jgi:hypothetical protein
MGLPTISLRGVIMKADRWGDPAAPETGRAPPQSQWGGNLKPGLPRCRLS